MSADYEVLIVGAGPAGLTAGIYTARAGLKTMIIEKKFPGGQVALTDFVENYPGFPEGVIGWDLVSAMQQQAERFGVEIRTEDVVALKDGATPTTKIVETDQGAHSAISVIVATGASYKKIEIPGEDKFYGKGVSQCATCDGAFYKDKEVIVVGGGDSALQETLFLSRLCSVIHLVHRRDKFRAVKALQDRIFSLGDKVKVHFNSCLAEILGDQKVEGALIRNTLTNEKWRLPAEGVFVFIGMNPVSAFLKGYVKTDEAGYVLVDEEMKTSVAGVFACGDVLKKEFRQIVTACGEGALAASSAENYVEEVKGIAYK